MPNEGRLLVVSNRLPITLRKEENQWHYTMSSGGLVSALSGLKQSSSFLWIGWPGKFAFYDTYCYAPLVFTLRTQSSG